MSSPTQITDHVDAGVLNLTSFLQDKPLLVALLSGPLTEVQELEDFLFDILDGRMLDTAVGVQLDILGELVGEPDRAGATDAEYRKLIGARILTNRSRGEVWRCSNILAILLGVTVQYFPLYPAGLDYQALAPAWLDPLYWQKVARWMQDDAVGSGIKINSITFALTPGFFCFGTDLTTPEVVGGLGFGETVTFVASPGPSTDALGLGGVLAENIMGYY